MESESDAAYDSGVDFDNISLASLDDLFKERDFIHERFYSTLYRDRHPFPIDEREQERQRRQFSAYLELFQGRLCPTSAKEACTVLDVKTGAGYWAIGFADEHPSSMVYGIDAVYMQEQWVPNNCEFFLEHMDRPDWYYSFQGIDFVHVGGLCGDRQLLTCLLDGAYSCCSSSGVIEIWDSTVVFQDPNCESALHQLWNDMEEAYTLDGRLLCLPVLYPMELKRCGFVNVVEHVYHLPLNEKLPDLGNAVVTSWADGFEAYSMELLVKHLGKRSLDVSISCAAARQVLQQGVEGWLQIRVTSGQKPATHL